MLLSLRRLRYQLVLLTVLAVCFLGPIWLYAPDKLSYAYANQLLFPNTRTPSVDELEAGRWVPRIPPFTTDDLATRWQGMYKLAKGLSPLPPDADGNQRTRTKHEEEQAKMHRSVQLANWVWEGLGTVDEPDWDDWLVRLLDSNGGCIIIGDSIQFQLFKLLRWSLPWPIPLAQKQTSIHGFPASQHSPSLYTLTIPPSSPLAKRLLDHAASRSVSIPIERFQRPILSYVRSDMLVDLETLIRLRDEVALETEPDFFTKYKDNSDYKASSQGLYNIVFGDWQGFLNDSLLPYAVDDGTTWNGRRKTVLVVNTGAHWSPGSIRKFTQDQMKLLYDRTVPGLFSLLRSYNASTRLMYRPSVAGHDKCETYAAPVSNTSELAPVYYEKHWGWNLFDKEFNEPWERLFEGEEGIRWMPVWLRSALRPDDHQLSHGDCLHMGGPGVVDEWGRWVVRLVGEMDAAERVQ